LAEREQNEQIDHFEALHVTAGGDRLGTVEVKAAQDYRQPPERHPPSRRDSARSGLVSSASDQSTDARRAFGGAPRELERLLRDRAGAQSAEADGAFVRDAERVISLRNEAWMACGTAAADATAASQKKTDG
jgi:hypothetical protein